MQQLVGIGHIRDHPREGLEHGPNVHDSKGRTIGSRNLGFLWITLINDGLKIRNKGNLLR